MFIHDKPFCEDFFLSLSKFKFIIFSKKIVHIKKLLAKGLHFLIVSSFSLVFSKIGSKWPAHLFIANIWIFQQHVWLLHRKILYYLKMNFGHTQEQTITHLQFKFELLSA